MSCVERWLPLKKTWYEISDNLNVRNKITGRILKVKTSKSGGRWTTLSVKGELININITKLAVKMFYK